jgi:hypothetical protein
MSFCGWIEDAAKLLMSPLISRPFQMAWKTQQDWLSGKEVVQYQHILTCNLKEFAKVTNPLVRLWLVPGKLIEFFCPRDTLFFKFFFVQI